MSELKIFAESCSESPKENLCKLTRFWWLLAIFVIFWFRDTSLQFPEPLPYAVFHVSLFILLFLYTRTCVQVSLFVSTWVIGVSSTLIQCCVQLSSWNSRERTVRNEEDRNWYTKAKGQGERRLLVEERSCPAPAPFLSIQCVNKFMESLRGGRNQWQEDYLTYSRTARLCGFMQNKRRNCLDYFKLRSSPCVPQLPELCTLLMGSGKLMRSGGLALDTQGTLPLRVQYDTIIINYIDFQVSSHSEILVIWVFGDTLKQVHSFMLSLFPRSYFTGKKIPNFQDHFSISEFFLSV